MQRPERPDDRVRILVVDDKPDQLVTLHAVLSELGEEVVEAGSGAEALRLLLRHDFAVILLDVNMPGMDGFETAALIRQRQSLQQIPIIFVTAFSDELYLARGYSLGAVDFILSPVVPEILRTKVSVFIDLFKKTRQVKRQAAFLEQRADQLHRLTETAVAINATLSVPDVLQLVADRAREIVGAHEARVTTNLLHGWARAQQARSVSGEGGVDDGQEAVASPGSLVRWVCSQNQILRLRRPELQEHPAWDLAEGEAPEGILVVPLRGRDGRNIGLIELRGQDSGEFAPDDETIALQLAQMASIAIENTLYYEAREANRIKDEFLATLSHELRTPLNAVLGWTVLLRTQNIGEEDRREGLEVIERNVKVQSKLIEDLLDVSRISAGKLRLSMDRVLLQPIVLAATDAVRPVAEAKDVELDARMHSSRDEVFGDADRLQQVIWNLLSNAVKFTPKGGRVSIELERKGKQVLVHVRDNGSGISPDFLPYVFERFRQADIQTTRTQSGLGIGLAIVRHLVELHGGSVEAHSGGENRGSVFTVRLPCCSGAREAGSPPEVDGTPSPVLPSPRELEGRCILVVDDEADSRDLFSAILEREGVQVILASSAPEALERVEEADVELVVSDIAMPGMDGYTLIRSIRRREEGVDGAVPAIALTAFAREEDCSRAQAAGFDLHIAKPVDPDELLESIAGLLANRRSSSSKGVAESTSDEDLDLEDRRAALDP